MNRVGDLPPSILVNEHLKREEEEEKGKKKKKRKNGPTGARCGRVAFAMRLVNSAPVVRKKKE